MMMRLLAQILDQAVRDKLRAENSARDPELKVHLDEAMSANAS